jgi:hypothetical protein
LNDYLHHIIQQRLLVSVSAAAEASVASVCFLSFSTTTTFAFSTSFLPPL